MSPAIFLYDSVQGGVGLSDLLYDGQRTLIEAALDVVHHCACRSGCPGCVGPPEEVGALGKECASRVLAHLAHGARLRPVPLPGASAEAALESQAP
jgi:DEAD/DEAH box helicase domain-containing protein